MIRLTSRLLLSFVWVFILQEVTTAKIQCQPGQMATIYREKCVPCPPDQYNPYPGDAVECRNCVPCDEYSAVVSPCTPISNTKCRCLEGFTPLDKDEEECRCEKGSGIKEKGNKMVCEKCPDGSFTSRSNSRCQPWTKCDEKGGVKTSGSSVSDVICRNASTDIEKRVTAPPVPPSTGPSANAPTVARTTTKLSNSRVSVSHVTPSIGTPNIRQHSLWLAPLGCVLALLLIQLVIMKMKFTGCFFNKQAMIRKDSACTKPVEESGEKFLPSVV